MANPDLKPGRHFEVYEIVLFLLGIGTSLALFAGNQRNAVLVPTLAGTIIYGIMIYACRSAVSKSRLQRFSFLISFLYVSWFYWSVARITPALGETRYDKVLLGLDRAIFGHTPAIYLGRIATSWLSDLMSLCYLTYHLYLAIIVVDVLREPNFASLRFRSYLFLGFAIGFAGYLLVPAVGPSRAYPQLFPRPLPGGIISKVVEDIVTKGSSVYDVFPSLHVLITCILLDHDWRGMRRRFWVMVGPAFGLIASTIYLRYHYGVDILAGVLLFLGLRQAIMQVERRNVAFQQ